MPMQQSDCGGSPAPGSHAHTRKLHVKNKSQVNLAVLYRQKKKKKKRGRRGTQRWLHRGKGTNLDLLIEEGS